MTRITATFITILLACQSSAYAQQPATGAGNYTPQRTMAAPPRYSRGGGWFSRIRNGATRLGDRVRGYWFSENEEYSESDQTSSSHKPYAEPAPSAPVGARQPMPKPRPTAAPDKPRPERAQPIGSPYSRGILREPRRLEWRGVEESESPVPEAPKPVEEPKSAPRDRPIFSAPK